MIIEDNLIIPDNKIPEFLNTNDTIREKIIPIKKSLLPHNTNTIVLDNKIPNNTIPLFRNLNIPVLHYTNDIFPDNKIPVVHNTNTIIPVSKNPVLHNTNTIILDNKIPNNIIPVFRN